MGAEAERDIRSIHDRIAQDKPQAADKWAERLQEQILSLDILPERCAVIPEADFAGSDYRHLISGNYRVIYRVHGNRVLVVRVIHAARRLLRHMLHEVD
jgi:plasmid stabilization system protein ParE